MNITDFKQLVKETVSKEVIREGINLDVLSDGISTSSMIGKPWLNLIMALETVIGEVKDFRTSYTSQEPLPQTIDAMRKFQQIVYLLNEVKPTILSIDDIQKHDD